MSDLISRQAAINAIENTKSAKSEDGEIYVAKINAEMNIQLLQSVSTEKTGHWKPFDLTYGRSIYYCTACNESTELPTCMGEPLYKYCPNCGCRMGVEE